MATIHRFLSSRTIALLLTLTGVAGAASQPANRPTTPLSLRLADQGWGDADPRDIMAVLQSVARELVPLVPAARIPTLEIHPRGGPIVLYARTAGGDIVVKLNTGDRYWSQYAFQFSHELCHVLCGYTERNSGNKWFEESLCETASLFVLRQMGQTWKTDAPYPNWKGYAASLTRYANERLADFKLAPPLNLAQWYRQNEAALRKEATNRKLNGIVAARLLPLLEKDPTRWGAIASLNHGETDAPRAFAQFLQDWHDRVKPEHREFVKEVGTMFEIELKGGSKG